MHYFYLVFPRNQKGMVDYLSEARTGREINKYSQQHLFFMLLFGNTDTSTVNIHQMRGSG